MLPTYEAIYENGRLRRLGEAPKAGRHHILVTVLDRVVGPLSREEVEAVLKDTRGLWGSHKSVEEIDAELDRIRDEWERKDAPRDTETQA